MADTVKFPRPGFTQMLAAYLEDAGRTFKVALMATTYTYDPDAHVDMADVNAHELNQAATGTGYVAGFAGAGRQTLAGLAVTQTAGGCVITADPVTFAGLQADLADVKGYLIYEHDTDDAGSPILVWVDFDSDYDPDGNDLVVTPHATNGFGTVALAG